MVTARQIIAGKLRSIITIQQPDPGQDAMGAPLDTWTTFATVWAQVSSIGGSEAFRGEQFSPEVTHEVTVRWIDGLLPTFKIVTSDNRTFDILYVNYGERKVDPVVMQCKERVGADVG